MIPAVRDAARALTSAGVASPQHDAEELAAHLLETTRHGLLANGGAAGGLAGLGAEYKALVARRVAREPLQYVTGRAPFRYLELAVGPGVFVPRPETELLVDLVLPHIASGAVVVDLCSGSGAVALALATEKPGLTVHAVEVDGRAADWLRRNVAAIAPAVTVHVCAVSDALADEDGTLDVVVANPPYLPLATVEAETLEPEVTGYDPPLALWGGSDGLDVIRDVIRTAARLLAPGGFLALEHDATHQREVMDLVQNNQPRGFHDVLAHRDLTGRPRFVTAVAGSDRRAGR